MAAFNKSVLKEVEALFARYPKKIHALLPVLHLVQRENEGWLPQGWDAYVAELCGTTLNHVRGVVTFYNMFHTKPVGRYHIMVCTCVPCGLCNGDKTLEYLEHKLDIAPGQTTRDGLFSLEEAQCLAACDKAPLMLVNEELHARVTEETIDQWIADAKGSAAKGNSG